MRWIKIMGSKDELAHVLISLNVGWRHEPEGLRGISHFLEHAVFLGNEEHENPDAEVARYGVVLNGETNAERTIFSFTSLPEDAEEILKIFLSIILNPGFPEEKLEEERESKIIPAVVNEEDYQPWELAYEWARNLLFDWDFRYSMGTEEELRKMDSKMLKSWHRRYYHPNNMVILSNQQFDIALNSQGGENPQIVKVAHKSREITIEKKLKNAEIVYGFPIKSYDVRAHLLSIVLGNYPHSPLFRYFHRHTYMVESQVEFHSDRGGFFLYFGSTNRSTLDRDIHKFIENVKIREEELSIAKKIAKIEYGAQCGVNAIERFVKLNPEFTYDGFESLINDLEKISLKEINDFASEVLSAENKVKSVVV